MTISGEGILGLALTLFIAAASGAAIRWPEARVIGIVIMSFSLAALALLIANRLYQGWGNSRLLAVYGMIVCMGGFVVCAAFYFSPERPSTHKDAVMEQEQDKPPSPPLPVTTEPRGGTVGVELGGRVIGNVFDFTVLGADTAVKSSGLLEGNDMTVVSAPNAASLPQRLVPTVDFRNVSIPKDAEIHKRVDRVAAVLDGMQSSIDSKIPDQAALQNELMAQLKIYLSDYDKEARDLEYVLLTITGKKAYSADRPVLLSKKMAAGVRPFKALGSYLKSF